MVEHGSIIWIDFDPHSGHEQGGRRPALVISNKTYNENSSVKILVPISQLHSYSQLRLSFATFIN